MQLNPGVTNTDVAASLEAIKPRYRELVSHIQAQANAATTAEILPLPEIPAEVQLRIFKRISEEILKGAGHDLEGLEDKGTQLEFTSSPTGVCWGHSKDIVLSVETYPDDIAKGLSNVWHETGHLLYLLSLSDLPPDIQGKPVANFNGFGVHEAVAMTMEQAGLRKRAFELAAPVVKKELAQAKAEGLLPQEFDINDPALSPENLHRKGNRPDLSNMDWCTSELSLTPIWH